MEKIQRRLFQDLSLTEQLRIRARAALELRNREVHDLKKLVRTANPRFIWYRHCEVIGSVIERVFAGALKNVMFFLPPRHSKSELISRLGTACYLKKFPLRQVGLASYASDLAWSLSMDARDNYTRMGGQIREDASAKKEWRTLEGEDSSSSGGLWASGVRGPITGKGFDLGVIDDPLKNEDEAYSETIREGVNQWYDSTWFTRREPDAAELLIMTRWHHHDLAGHLLEKEKTEPRSWHIVILQAIKEEYLPEFPPSCTIEPDWRNVGQALCPERYDEKVLAVSKGTVGTEFWTSMFQQRPTQMTGDVWKKDWFKEFKPTPKFIEEMKITDIGKDWDLAYTEEDSNSACAFIEAGKDEKNNVYIFDLAFRWCEFPELIRWMVNAGGPHYIEQKASGKSAAQTLRKNGIYAKEVKVDGGMDKTGRAKLATPAAESGHVFVAAHIMHILLADARQGVLSFPKGSHSDVNDCLVQAINRLYKRGMLIHFGIIGDKHDKG